MKKIRHDFTPEELIVKHLDDNGQRLKWLATSIGVTTGHLHCVLKGVGDVKRPLTSHNREKINQTLKTNY